MGSRNTSRRSHEQQISVSLDSHNHSRRGNCFTCRDASGSSLQSHNESQSTPTIKFPRNFSAYKLAHSAGFEIVWTSNLLGHLRINEENEKLRVHVFHQVTLPNFRSLKVEVYPVRILNFLYYRLRTKSNIDA